MVTTQWSHAQSRKWEKVETAKQTISQTEAHFQEMLQDKAYNLGTDKQPSPRFGASSWQTGEGEWVLFSGAGFDPDGNWGLLDDMWKYSASDNKWTLLSGQRKVDTRKWSEQTELPIPRRNAVRWADNQGNLYLMGGIQLNDTEHFYDLWKYSVKAGIWNRLSGKTIANVNAVRGQQKGKDEDGNNPGSRSGAVTWTDKNGNLWLFGGANMDNAKGQQDLYNDLWTYSAKTGRWAWVSGSDKPNQKGKFKIKGDQEPNLAPSARTSAAAWYDDQTGKLWLYGGSGIDSTGMDSGGLSDLWSYDPGKNLWQWVSGSTELFANNDNNQANPGYRWSAATWKDQKGNFMLYGGQNKVSATEVDINPTVWKFDLQKQKWTPLLVQGTPGIMNEAEAFTDSSGELLLFGGRKFNPQTRKGYPTNEIWKIKTN